MLKVIIKKKYCALENREKYLVAIVSHWDSNTNKAHINSKTKF